MTITSGQPNGGDTFNTSVIAMEAEVILELSTIPERIKCNGKRLIMERNF